MKNWQKTLLAANLALLLGVVGYEVYKKELNKREGKLLLLRLAPVDPLSYMQGYYMDLRYEEARSLSYSDIPSRGFMIFSLDSSGVGKLRRTQTALQPLVEDEFPVKYFYNDRFVSIGAESYFFEEGQASKYDSAQYGALRVLPSGESLLVGLYDKQRQFIEP